MGKSVHFLLLNYYAACQDNQEHENINFHSLEQYFSNQFCKINELNERGCFDPEAVTPELYLTVLNFGWRNGLRLLKLVLCHLLSSFDCFISILLVQQAPTRVFRGWEGHVASCI